MQYLVQMKLVAQGRQTTRDEGIAFIEQVILPSLEMCEKMREEKKILAGGPISGTIGMAMIVDADSALELDEIIARLPIWPRAEVNVTPLTTFEDRAKVIAKAIRRRLEQLKAQTQGTEASGG
jgi:muconolactone delta-isomerase